MTLLKTRAAAAAAAAFAGALAFLPAVAHAGYIATYSGTDCAGTFGQPFSACRIPGDVDPNRSPVIIKFGFNDETNTLFVDEINSALFPTVDGSEFSFLFTGDGETGTWTYTPGAGDPGITYFVAKGGNFFNLFSTGGLGDSWFTPTNPANQKLFGLSHLTFYDTGDGDLDVPEPGSLALLAIGVIAAAALRRRRR